MNSQCEALFRAVAMNDLQEIKQLVQAGVDLNICAEAGCSALYTAALFGHLAIVQELLEAGCNPNLADEANITPLNVCATSGSYKGLRLLLSHPDIHVDVANSTFYHTPLHNAALRGHTSCVRALLENGADQSIKDYNGCVAKDLAKDGLIREYLTLGDRLKELYYQLRRSGNVNYLSRLSADLLDVVARFASSNPWSMTHPNDK